MKEEWITVKEFADREGIKRESVYHMILKEKNKNPSKFNQKFKKEGKNRLINYAFFPQNEGAQAKFERLYFILLDQHGNDFQIAKLLSKHMNTPVNYIYMYFRDCFVTRKASNRKLEYIEAMEKVLKEKR